jgi:hypothetical protein
VSLSPPCSFGPSLLLFLPYCTGMKRGVVQYPSIRSRILHTAQSSGIDLTTFQKNACQLPSQFLIEKELRPCTVAGHRLTRRESKDQSLGIEAPLCNRVRMLTAAARVSIPHASVEFANWVCTRRLCTGTTVPGTRILLGCRITTWMYAFGRFAGIPAVFFANTPCCGVLNLDRAWVHYSSRSPVA